jgi:hypothetical protein
MRRGLIAIIAAVLLVPSAGVATVLLWKREVAFPRDHWRFRYHVAGTALASFPIVRPVSEPVYKQRISSAFVPWLSLTYITGAPLPDFMRTVAGSCPDAPWARLDEAGLLIRARQMEAFSCAGVLFWLVDLPESLRINVLQTD